MTPYLVDDVDEGLGFASSQASDHFDRFCTQRDCLDKRGKLIPRRRSTDQAFQSLFTRVGACGWFNGSLYGTFTGLSVKYMVKMTPFGDLTMEDTNIVCIERTVSWECRAGEKDNALQWEQTTACAVRVHQPRGHRLASRPPDGIQNS